MKMERLVLSGTVALLLAGCASRVAREGEAPQLGVVRALLTGPYVAIRERVSWTSKSGRKSQAALGIYEVRDGLVQRVWYYPAVEHSNPSP